MFSSDANDNDTSQKQTQQFASPAFAASSQPPLANASASISRRHKFYASIGKIIGLRDTMAATDGQIILAASRFSDAAAIYLRDFCKTELPAIAKIVKGQHSILGVPTLSNPSLQSTALFLYAGKRYQILAQPIKIKEGRKHSNVGPKILLPETYPGYFELLSEDGRSTRCIESVLDLSRKPNLRVIVRETLRCSHLNKTIAVGDVLTVMHENGKFLMCKTLKEEVISLSLDAKAKFSPIAKEDSISGVHTVKNLLKKRMPIVVRLVHGTAPKGLKQPFVPEMRLLGCVEVERVFALPLLKDTDLFAVPNNAKIKLQRAKNMDQLASFAEYSRLMDKAQKLLADACDRLQIVDMKLPERDKKPAKIGARKAATSSDACESILDCDYILHKSMSCDLAKCMQQADPAPLADDYDDIDEIYDYVRGFAPKPKTIYRYDETTAADPSQSSAAAIVSAKCNELQSKSQPDSGNYSLTKSSSNVITHMDAKRSNSIYYHHSIVESNQMQEEKPVPPPIETIPGKKKLPEKRNRPMLPKLYIKNLCSQKSRSPTSNISPSNGVVAITGKDALEPQSPLFHIRYKSLSSLQLASDSATANSSAFLGYDRPVSHKLTKSASTNYAREGTLDSSRSGGRTSGESKLPEKKTRRLSRPRSLSNLVWELRSQKERSKKKLYVHNLDQSQSGTLYL